MNTASTKPFEWNAADYAKSSSMQQQWARELIQKLNLSGNEHVLDVGSGDGKVTAEIASAVSRGSGTWHRQLAIDGCIIAKCVSNGCIFQSPVSIV